MKFTGVVLRTLWSGLPFSSHIGFSRSPLASSTRCWAWQLELSLLKMASFVNENHCKPLEIIVMCWHVSLRESWWFDEVRLVLDAAWWMELAESQMAKDGAIQGAVRFLRHVECRGFQKHITTKGKQAWCHMVLPQVPLMDLRGPKVETVPTSKGQGGESRESWTLRPASPNDHASRNS